MINMIAQVICNKCGALGVPVLFEIPAAQETMRRSAREEAKTNGWKIVIENGDRIDYCPKCAERMKMVKKND
jgi:predicted RNA-binding Zn-ribbon protein involved in translation (DUF1610 family)